MSYLDALFGMAPQAGRPAADADFWYGPVSETAHSGVQVNEETSLRAAAMLACLRVLSETIASLPYPVYERRSDGGKDRRVDHPVYDLMQVQANEQMTAFDFRQLRVVMMGLWGNWYCRIVPGRRGAVDSLEPLHPDRVKVERLNNGRLRYEYRTPEGEPKRYTQDEVQRIPGLSLDGVVGVETMSVAREALGLALAAEGYAARFFANDARPGGILTTDQAFKDPERLKQIAESWTNAHGGVNQAHKTAVLHSGLKYQEVSKSPGDVQLVDTRTAQALEIARIMRVQPHKIGILDRATFSNIEQQSIEFVVDTIMPWLIRFEQAERRDLITNPQRFFLEHIVEGLLRGDSKARAEFYQSGVQNGWLTRNEVRRLENLNPLPGLDTPLTPQNMAPTRGNRDAAQVRLHRMAFAAADRVVRKEINAMATEARRHANSEGEWAERVQAFYGEHAAFVAEALCVGHQEAQEYAEAQCRELLNHGPTVLDTWREGKAEQLANMALGDTALANVS